jgi:hypothetical protein
MWHDLTTNPFDSVDFLLPLLLLIGISLLMVLLSWRYVVMAYPSDETFFCDRSTLTISKVRWLDIQNSDWQTQSYPLGEVTAMKYQTIARAKGAAIYGLKFRARGKSKRVLPGLGTSDAGKILEAVRAFQGNVSH